MAGGYTPWLPKRYYQRFKYRAWRLFGRKLDPSERGEIIDRASHTIGMIRQKRFNSMFSRILKENYSDLFMESLTKDCILLKALSE